MRIFVEEYGRLLVTILCCLFLGGFVLSGFMDRWRSAGGVSDSVKTNFRTNEEKRTAPVIRAEDFKAVRGDKISFSRFISAVDFDGRDITGQVEIAVGSEEMGGNNKLGYQNIITEFRESIWDTQGIFRFTLKVKSPVTGKVTRGKLVVLVDCLGNGDGRENG